MLKFSNNRVEQKPQSFSTSAFFMKGFWMIRLKSVIKQVQCSGSCAREGVALRTEAPALKCQVANPRELLVWMLLWQLILCCRKPRLALSHKMSYLK